MAAGNFRAGAGARPYVSMEARVTAFARSEDVLEPQRRQRPQGRSCEEIDARQR